MKDFDLEMVQLKAHVERFSKLFRVYSFEELIKDCPDGITMLRFECECGNRCLVDYIPSECSCLNPRWYLIRRQETYKVDGEDWTHPFFKEFEID